MKPSKETNQEYDEEEEVEDGSCNRTPKMAEHRKGRMEENAEDEHLEGEDSAKIVEPCVGRNQEDDGVEEEEEDEEEEDDLSYTVPSNTSSLVELNLLIVVLSLFSASTEESLNGEERTKVRSPKNHEEKVAASRLQPRRREMNEFKVVGRQTPRMRFQTTIKDSRLVVLRLLLHKSYTPPLFRPKNKKVRPCLKTVLNITTLCR